MLKAIFLFFFKFTYWIKGLLSLLASLLDDLILFFDDLSYLIFNSLRSIRFEEVREFIIDNFLTLSLILILIILIFSYFHKTDRV